MIYNDKRMQPADEAPQLSQAEIDEVVGAMVRHAQAGATHKELRVVAFKMFAEKFLARAVAKFISDGVER